ncbi:MAG: ThuA domain-containing protein [Maribacter litoralis]|uniref:ThuA domain-containing protein n=1 Tax=Maribacter litoralis TaxID=2059726 RepID=UPI00329A15EC
MKINKTLKIVLQSFLGLVLLLFTAMGVFMYKALYGINFYDSAPPELPADLSGKTVLLFSKTNGFRHGEAIEASIPAFENMARENGWALYSTDNGAVFNADQLNKFDVVIWNNTSGKTLNEEQRNDLKIYINDGGGFVGIHAAGDNSHQWDWYEEKVLGTLFSHHTLNPQFQMATMNLENGNESLSQNLISSWEREEEWYVFYDNPRDKGFNILYTVDESNMNMSGNIPILASGKDFGMDKDHPIVWYNTIEKGRVLYSALGHSGNAFKEPNHLQMLENAISWAGKFEE